MTGIFQALGIQQPRKAEKNPMELTFLCKPSLSPTALNVDSCADSFFSLSIFIIKTQMEMGGDKRAHSSVSFSVLQFCSQKKILPLFPFARIIGKINLLKFKLILYASLGHKCCENLFSRRHGRIYVFQSISRK